MRHHVFIAITIVAALAIASARVVYAQEQEGSASTEKQEEFPVQARAELYARFENDRRLAGAQVFAPLTWNGSLLSFADLRFSANNEDGQEFNAGLGLRRIFKDAGFILGGYGFFDRRRSSTGNFYNQATVGGEILGELWDLRANGYIPLTGPKEIWETRTSLPGSLAISGSEIMMTGGEEVTSSVERPMKGIDVEAGVKLPFLANTLLKGSRAYAAGFRFGAHDIPTMEGMRFRAETGQIGLLRFGGGWQTDNLRGGMGFVEARISVPLGDAMQAIFGTGEKSSGQPRQFATPNDELLRRLDARIERDIDIVTQSSRSQRQQIAVAPLAATSSGTTLKIYFVDNAAASGGDGTLERPYNALAEAQAIAGANDIIYVRRGDGTSTGQNAGITLNKPDEKLLGSGVALTYDIVNMRQTIPGVLVEGQTILPAGSAPTITNVSGNGVTITGANVEVAGINVQGASDNGIYVYNASGANIHDVATSGNAHDGLRVEANDAGITSATIERVAATGNKNGVRLYAQNNGALSAKVESSIATGNSQHGIIVYDDSASGNVDADLGGGDRGSMGLNAITGNALEDLTFDADGVVLQARNNWWGQAGGPYAGQIYKGAPMDDGLVANWRFDAAHISGTTVYDRSGNNYSGAMYGGMSAGANLVDGPGGGALNFDGIDDAIKTGNIDLSATKTITISYWRNISVYTDSTGIEYELSNNFNNASGGFFSSADDNSGCGGMLASSIHGNSGYNIGCFTRFPANSWVLVTQVLDMNSVSAEQKVYYNGILQSTAFQMSSSDNTNAFGNLPFNIMARDASSLFARDKISDFRIYDHALSQAEIAELYRTDASGTVESADALSSAP